jgi:hypothetical protein
LERKTAIVDGWIEKADKATGEVIAVVNTGNVKDLQGDTMAHGCWADVISSGQEPALCWFHKIDDIRGSVLTMEELPPGDPRVPLNRKSGEIGAGTASGLVIKGQFEMETQAGRDAFTLVKNRRVKQWSVQFDVDEADVQKDAKGDRVIKRVKNLYEVSPVLVGASPGTLTVAAKQSIPSEPINRPAVLNVHDIPAHLIALPAIQFAAVQRARQKFMKGDIHA